MGCTLNYKIRPASKKDKNSILSVIGSYRRKWDKDFAERYYNDFFQKNSALSKRDRVYVYADKKEVIGVIGYSLDYYETDNNYWLSWFYIHKDYNGNGYGIKLLDYLIKRLKSKGVQKLFVNTSSNEFYLRALKIYREYGFNKEAVIRNYYENAEHQIILSKLIG